MKVSLVLCGCYEVHFYIGQRMRLSIYQSLGQEIPTSSREFSHSSGASLTTFACV
jgi:hypothetical protein